MKMAMKLTIGILATAITMTAGAAWSQSPDAIDNARSAAKSLQQQQANDSSAAPAPVKAKPAPGEASPAVKPAAIPGAKSASASAHNQLQHVSVAQGTDTIQIEISSSQAVTPRVSKLSSPNRVLVELPETVIASSQTKIPVGSNGVKGVRVGMDGKTPPTTSVVVDLENAMAFDLTPGSAGKVVLTLHTQGGSAAQAKNGPVPVKAAPAPQKTVATKSATPVAQPAVATKVPTAQPAKAGAPVAQPKAAAGKPAAVPAPPAAVAGKSAAPAQKVAAANTPAVKSGTTPSKADTKQLAKAMPAVPVPVKAPAAVPAKTEEAAKPKQEEKKWAMNGKRDPFFSPVVQQSGSGCSTGKKCLEINAINLRGVVKSDAGFIAVVTNNLNKAYFLRENDPVFNGYVVKITGDSVVFQETIQDKLGKPFTREVVKRIFTPAV